MRFATLAVLVACAQLSVAGAPPRFSFHTRTDLQTSLSVAVVSADFNGDGLADLAALGAASIQVFLNKGHRQFAAPISIGLGGFPSSYDTLAVADINGDGRPDLIASSGTDSPIFFGNGDGTFSAGPVLATWGLPVVHADFNGDGQTDLAFAQGNSIQVLLGHGDGTFAPPIVVAGPASCLTAGDFNGDGKPDLLGCDNGVAVFLGNGDGTFAAPITSATPSAPIFAVAGDLDQDGKLDVAAVAFTGNGSNPNLGPVYVLYGNGDGTFQPTLQVHTDIGTVFSVGIGDLNGDGLPDLVAASHGADPFTDFTGGALGTYFNNGAKGFTKGTMYPVTFVNQLPWATMLVTDLDGDHVPDVAVCDNGGLYFSTLFNSGKGQLQDIQNVPLPGKLPSGQIYGSPLSVAQGNFDGKAAGELAMIFGNTQLQVFQPTGQPAHPFRLGPATTLQPPAGFNSYSIVAGDFNGDGTSDVAIGFANFLFTSSAVQVYLGKGDGTFSLASQFNLPMTGIQMITADFNADGKLDIATSSGFLALGNGDGTFQNPTAFYSISPLLSTFGVWLAAADFNHDGKLDIAFQTPQNGAGQQPLLIFPGNGDGTFQKPAAYLWGALPAWGAMADFNGDGNPDIALLSAQHPRDMVAVLLGNADGTFQPASYLQLRYTVNPLSIVAADFNGDGNADLAVMDSDGSSLHLFAGNGDGTFGPDTQFGGALNMAWMGYGNYQGQSKRGYPDLVFVDTGANGFFPPSRLINSALSILLNDGWKK